MAFDSQRGKVLAALIARFQAMTVAGGYHYDVQPASVVSDPVNILTVPDPLLPFFLVETSPSSRVYQPASLVMVDAVVLVTFRVQAPGTSPTRKAEAGENLFADVEKAVAADYTLGGLVIDARLDEPDGPMVGMGTNNNVFGIVKIKTRYIPEIQHAVAGETDDMRKVICRLPENADVTIVTGDRVRVIQRDHVVDLDQVLVNGHTLEDALGPHVQHFEPYDAAAHAGLPSDDAPHADQE